MDLHTVTLRRDEPIPVETMNSPPSILKRQIISLPRYPSISRSDSSVVEARNKKREYQKKMQHQQTIDEIAAFERKLGETPEVPPPLDFTPITKEQRELLQSFAPPSPIQYWDIYTPPQSSPVSPRTRRIQSELAKLPMSQKNSPREEPITRSPPRKKPAPWTLLDEPILLSTNSIEHKPPREKRAPWYRIAKQGDNSRGIPLVTQDLRDDHEMKVGRYWRDVKNQIASDKRKREEDIKKRVNNHLTESRLKRERTAQIYNATGQDWVAKMISEKSLKQMRQAAPKPPTKDDLEAMEALNRREDALKAEASMRKLHLDVFDGF